jgi:hypothetical protein
MLNIHFEHIRAAALDNAIECSDLRKATLDYDMECGSITDFMWTETAADVDPGPAGMFMVPIYPRKDNTQVELVMIEVRNQMLLPAISQINQPFSTQIAECIAGKQIWQDLLRQGFENDVNGLHVVPNIHKGSHLASRKWNCGLRGRRRPSRPRCCLRECGYPHQSSVFQ